jgi:hypothetical protein
MTPPRDRRPPRSLAEGDPGRAPDDELDRWTAADLDPGSGSDDPWPAGRPPVDPVRDRRRPDDLRPDDREPRWPRPSLPRPTPVRVVLAIALIASTGVVAYGLIDRDAAQLPVLTAGCYVSGVVFVLLALAGAWAAYSQARIGSGLRALVYAVMGGLAALISAGCFVFGVVLTMTLKG